MRDDKLRRATMNDVDALHDLLALPLVNEYLADGVAPPRDAVVGWMEKSDADFAAAGIGVWLIDGDPGQLIGCLRLDLTPDDAEWRAAELSYLLTPEAWGRGLATRMAAAGIRAALASGAVDRVFAGADRPNRRSIAVMERLGMRFCRDVTYPMWPGVEYELCVGDRAVSSLPDSVPFVASLAEGATP